MSQHLVASAAYQGDGYPYAVANGETIEVTREQYIYLLKNYSSIFTVAPLLNVAAGTTEQTSDDQMNDEGAKGVIVTLDFTVEADTVELTPTIEAKIGSKYETLLTAAAAITAVGTHSYVIHPDWGTAANAIDVVGVYLLPLQWRVKVAVADTDAATYTVTHELLF